MATLVQALPSATGSMLSGRPSSSGGYSSSQASHQAFRTPNMARYNNQAGPGYRGMPSSGPVAPYAFTSTPQLSHTGVRPQHPGHGQRSAPSKFLGHIRKPQQFAFARLQQNALTRPDPAYACVKYFVELSNPCQAFPRSISSKCSKS
jgi:hypothetical protein